MAEETKFTHIGISVPTQKKISILAKVLVKSGYIYDLAALWADEAWDQARKAGLVTDAMLEPRKAHIVGKKNTVVLDDDNKQKLLKAVVK